MNGALCAGTRERPGHWPHLVELLHRCEHLEADLQDAIARRGRYGETVAATTGPAMPFNEAASDARRTLLGALRDALDRLGATNAPGTVDGAVAALIARESALQQSWAAAVLYADLVPAVRAAVAATDKPRTRPGIRASCPRCGARTFLELVMGSFRCRQCRETIPVGEVRGA